MEDPGVEFFYRPVDGIAIMHITQCGYFEFGEMCPRYWPEDEPPNLSGYIRFEPVEVV